MTDWQPIETAPTDATPVLTYRKAGFMAVAEYWAPDNWVISDGCVIIGVTHWMPLPEPPK